MAKRIVFFNNKGGVGKTTLVYHVAYMLNQLDYNVLVADFDPQTNLTALFLPQSRLEEIFLENNTPTITDIIRPVIEGESMSDEVYTETITTDLFQKPIHLLLGNLALSIYEDNLSDAWTKCLNGDVYAFKVTGVFDKILTKISEKHNIDYVLIDIAPNLGAINRAVLIASDFVVMPVAPDLFSLQGVKNLGKTLENWINGWNDRYNRNPKTEISLPNAKMLPVGYIAMQHIAKENEPVKAYLAWQDRIPYTYKKYVLKENIAPSEEGKLKVKDDENCLGAIRHYYSLMPMAMQARKPMFLLKVADGAIGSHFQTTKIIYNHFETLTKKIISVCV